MTDQYAELRAALFIGPAGELRLGLIYNLPRIVHELLAERDALAKDAARYRWLRDGAYHLIEPDRGLGPTIPCGDEMDIAVDAAIDAAMAGREGEG